MRLQGNQSQLIVPYLQETPFAKIPDYGESTLGVPSVHPKIADFRELATGAGQISCHIGRKMDWSGEILPVLRADFGGIGVHLCLLRRNRTYLWHSPEFGTSSIRKKGGMHAYAASFRRRFAFLMISCSRSSLPSRWTLAARIAVATTRAKPSRLVSRTRFQPR